MRIGIDISVLQGGSAQRGMGRYTLQQLIAVITDDHEFILFHQPFAPTPVLPTSLLKRENVTLVPFNFPEAQSLKGGKFSLKGEEAYTQAVQKFVAPYRLDLFHLTCFDDNAYYYTPRSWAVCPLVMTVYDLIPLLMSEVFLTNPEQRTSYMNALDLMKTATALIAISEDACQAVVKYLGVNEERVFIAPPYALSEFTPAPPSAPIPTIVKNIGGRYLYAISSLGEHKNLKRLIQAFAALPADIKSGVKLVISAGLERHSLPPDFTEMIKALDLENHLVWTPRLTDEQVIALYQHAVACPHISLIEGFGLPILEAMQCGTPVLTSNRGAMQEVAGAAARLVNPEDIADISLGLAEILTSPTLQTQLREAGLEQATSFNETRLADNTRSAYQSIGPRRLKVAMWSPLPPARSGISDYTAELIPYLTNYVDLVVYTNTGVSSAPFTGLPVTLRTYADYEQHQAEPIDLHVYHMGNNISFHEEIYFQLQKQPGIVVLHDLSIYNFFTSLSQKYPDDISLVSEVAYSEGTEAAAQLDKIIQRWSSSIEETNYLQLPMLRRVVENSLAFITHSEFGRSLIHRYEANKPVSVISLATQSSPIIIQNDALRHQLGWGDDDVAFGVFGGISGAKRVHIILEAFGKAAQTHDNIRLIIVGREDDPHYIDRLHQLIRKFNLDQRVTLVGEVPLDSLLDYIAAVDVAINLRWPTVGETSAVMLRVLGAGKPVMMSDVTQWSNFPDDFSPKIPVGENEIPTLIHTITKLAHNRKDVTELGEKARKYVEREASFEVVSQRYHAMIQNFASMPRPAAVPQKGINIIGDLMSDNGLGEVARSMVKLLSVNHIPVAYDELILDPVGRTTRLNPIQRGRVNDINLLHINAPFLINLMQKEFASRLAGKYNIGYWFYELPDFPPDWSQAGEYLDEIWVATTFVKDAIQKSIKTPVFVIPTPIHVPADIQPNRRRFNLPEDKFTFLFSFNPESSAGRKNPFGLLEAYRRAFENSDNRPMLVLKIQFLDKFPDLAREIRKRCRALGVHLIEENLSRDEMYTLISSCDCYISLHRSEGWGLGMAEAMAMGKPVIGTGWSGNVDFMTHDNSYLVDYALVPVKAEHHELQETYTQVFRPDTSHWADPDLNHAAQLMQYVVEHPDEAREVGRRAAKSIGEDFNDAVLGQHIRAHLATIDITRGKYYAPRPQPAPVTPPPTAQPIPRPLTPSQISGAGMSHLHRAYNDWNRERLRTTIRGFGATINRIPVLGFIFRTIIRIRNLGKVWGAESVVLEALIRELEVAHAQQGENSRLITELTAQLNQQNQMTAQLNQQLNQQNQTSAHQTTAMSADLAATRHEVESLVRNLQSIEHQTAAKIEAINHKISGLTAQLATISAEVASLGKNLQAVDLQTTTKIELLNNKISDSQTELKTLQAANERLTSLVNRLNPAITQLQDQQNTIDEQVHLNTSYVRLLFAELTDELAPNPPPPSILDVVRAVEFKNPALRQSDKVDFTIHGKIDDVQALSLGEYWQGRLTNISPDVWYHFDFSDHWQTPTFFNNIRAKLNHAGWLVVVVWSGDVVWPQADGFELFNQQTMRSGDHSAQVALYRKR